MNIVASATSDLSAARGRSIGGEPLGRCLSVEHRLAPAPLRRLVAAPRRRDGHEGQHEDLDDLDPLVARPVVAGRFVGHRGYPGSTLIARAITRMAVTKETADCTSIVIFAHVRTGSVSVGLNAVAFVNAR